MNSSETQLLVPEEAAVTRELSVMEILSQAVMSNDVKVDVVERLCALQRSIAKDEAELQFNDAMNRVQQKLSRINANMTNTHTSSKYADYAQIDRVIRPIYTAEGFSLSFSDGEPIAKDYVRIICYVSRGGHTRMYHKDMPVVTVGPQGKAVMTPTHATGSADAYAKRYLVKDIFNLAIGEDDDDGNGSLTDDQQMLIDDINRSRTEAEVVNAYKEATRQALATSNKTLIGLILDAKNSKVKQLKESANA